jgi:hypothetical protein
LKEVIETSINQAESRQCRIYPNPVSRGENLTVCLPETNLGKSSLSLYSMQGNLIYSKNISCKNGIFELPTATLPQSVYLFKAASGNQIFNNKIIVK